MTIYPAWENVFFSFCHSRLVRGSPFCMKRLMNCLILPKGDIGIFDMKAILYVMNRLAYFAVLLLAVEAFGATTILTFFCSGY